MIGTAGPGLPGYGLVCVLVMSGSLTFLALAAEGTEPLVSHRSLPAWLYPLFGLPGHVCLERRRPIMIYVLWIVQGVLALLFLFAGGMKLVQPIEALTAQMPLPGLFVRFIGVAEVLGAIGLILPGLLRIRPGLTSLAAAGLVIIMIGATVLTLAGGEGALALIPLVVGLLLAFVAYGRWRLAPHRGSSPPSVLRPAS